jgi:hypothetical protein
VQGNLIDVAADGVTALGNEPLLFSTLNGTGTNLTDGADQTLIGGTSPGERNIIVFDASKGVAFGLTAGSVNAIRGNSMFSNIGTGIHEPVPKLFAVESLRERP